MKILIKKAASLSMNTHFSPPAKPFVYCSIYLVQTDRALEELVWQIFSWLLTASEWQSLTLLLSWNWGLEQHSTQRTEGLFVFFKTCFYYGGGFKNPTVLIKTNLGNLELPKH